MSTYGFDPNKSKSKVEVYPKADVYNKTQVYAKSETYAKSEVYNRTEADGKFLTQTAGAPKNHASSASTYGLATASNYGHVKTTTSTSAPSGSQDGIALAGSMGYTLKNYTDSKTAEAKAYTDQLVKYIPVGGVIGCISHETGASFAAMMGYGTWEYCGTLTTAQGLTREVSFFRRTH